MRQGGRKMTLVNKDDSAQQNQVLYAVLLLPNNKVIEQKKH